MSLADEGSLSLALGRSQPFLIGVGKERAL
jgi:hypothetical protein